MASKARSMIAWTSSGSSRSDMAVKPDTSANMTVTVLRSPSMALLEVRIFSARRLGGKERGEAKRSATSPARSAGFSGRSAALSKRSAGLSEDVGAPHSPQNFFPGVSSAPQARHGIASDAPQSSQNFAPARFSAWHRWHFIASLQQV